MSVKKRVSPQADARRRRIAAGIVGGRSLAAIARDEGVSRQTIWKQSNSADTRQIVVAAVNYELEGIWHMFHRVLTVIEEGFEARVIRPGKDGKAVDLGPDHYARLSAVGALIKLLAAGRPLPKAPEPAPQRRGMTLAELEHRTTLSRSQPTTGAQAHAGLLR